MADNQVYTEADNISNITDVNRFYSVPPDAVEKGERAAIEDKGGNADFDKNDNSSKTE